MSSLKKITVWICKDCLSGKGGTCNTPGCFLIRKTAPDTPIDFREYEIMTESIAERDALKEQLQISNKRISGRDKAIAEKSNEINKLQEQLRKTQEQLRNACEEIQKEMIAHNKAEADKAEAVRIAVKALNAVCDMCDTCNDGVLHCSILGTYVIQLESLIGQKWEDLSR